MKQIYFFLFFLIILYNSVFPYLSCYDNCYLYKNNNKYQEIWCDKFNLPLSGTCQTNNTEGCIKGQIEINNKTIFFQTCENKTPVNFEFSSDNKCTEYSNYEQDNVLYFPFRNATRKSMKFRACKCFYNLCN